MELLTTDLALFEGRNPLPVSFIFKDDSVAEELETFNLTIATTSSLTGYTTSLLLMGTILDDDSKLTFSVEMTDSYSSSFKLNIDNFMHYY